MAISLTHTTVAIGTDAGNGEIAKAQWNENHTLTQATERLLGRTSAGVGATEEISVGTGLSLSGGTLTNTVTATAPGGSNTQLQFNNSGAFGGASGLTTNGTELTIASGTKTASAPVLDMSQTWNASGTTFTGLRFNATDTASAAGSLLMDLQVGGNSQFSLFKNGGIAGGTLRLGAANAAGSSITVSSVDTSAETVTLSSAHGLSSGAAVQFTTTNTLPGGITAGTTYYVRVTSTTSFELYDTYGNATAASGTTGRINITSAGTGTHTCNFGLPFQQLSVQSFTGTNIPGQPFVITGSQGTGTGRGGSIIFQVAPAGSSGTAQNALATALTINPQTTSVAGAVFAGAITVPRNHGYLFPVDGAYFVGMYSPAPYTIQFAMSAILPYSAGYSGLQFEMTTGRLSWGISTTQDIFLNRDDANILAQRNANNGQTFRLYGRFTDITNNFERFFINAPTTSGAAVQLGTQKGATTGAARALELQTDGTTRLTIATNGDLTIADAENIILGSTTGTKIGTATTQKIGFYNAAPVVQPTAVADATDNATAITQLNALLAHMRTLGLIAT